MDESGISTIYEKFSRSRSKVFLSEGKKKKKTDGVDVGRSILLADEAAPARRYRPAAGYLENGARRSFNLRAGAGQSFETSDTYSTCMKYVEETGIRRRSMARGVLACLGERRRGN